MMEAAGDDCAFQPLGRVLFKGAVVGFITHLGVCCPKASGNSAGRPLICFPSSEEFTDDLVPLVHHLHGKGVIHGDIKPSNILYYKKTSSFLFCGFGSAGLSNSTTGLGACSTKYITPSRAYGAGHPLNWEDDLQAIGITVWEVTSSQDCPISDIDEDYVEEIIMTGFQPNIYMVVDAATRDLMRSLLNAGFPQASACAPRASCVKAEVVYAECHARPPHRYMKTVHCSEWERDNCA